MMLNKVFQSIICSYRIQLDLLVRETSQTVQYTGVFATAEKRRAVEMDIFKRQPQAHNHEHPFSTYGQHS